jgi:hypothetical protein
MKLNRAPIGHRICHGMTRTVSEAVLVPFLPGALCSSVRWIKPMPARWHHKCGQIQNHKFENHESAGTYALSKMLS